MELTNENREDLLITALEGGSNYWYLLGCLTMTEMYRKPGESTAERIFRAAMKDEKIPVFDLESPHTKLGVISRERFIEGEKLMQKEQPKHYEDIVSDSWDASTADVWLQYVVMGELVFN